MSGVHHQLQYPSNSVIHPKPFLLQYEPPRLIVNHDISTADRTKICRATLSPCLQPSSFYDENLNLLDPYSDRCRPPDILDFLLPPVELTNKTNHKYITCVSRHPATGTDVHILEKNLNQRLKLSQALEIGLCDRRRRVYDECFDELVRQVTVECSERGILLSRVRNTYRQLMSAYSANYQSANAYAMRTILLNQQSKIKLNHQIDHLQYEIEQLRTQLLNSEDHYENVLKLYSRLKSANEYRYQAINTTVPLELQQLRATNKLLKQELENVLLKKLNLPVPDRTTTRTAEDEFEDVFQ